MSVERQQHPIVRVERSTCQWMTMLHEMPLHWLNLNLRYSRSHKNTQAFCPTHWQACASVWAASRFEICIFRSPCIFANFRLTYLQTFKVNLLLRWEGSSNVEASERSGDVTFTTSDRNKLMQCPNTFDRGRRIRKHCSQNDGVSSSSRCGSPATLVAPTR